MWRLIEQSEQPNGNAAMLRDWTMGKLTDVREACVAQLIDAGLRQSAKDSNRFARAISLIDDELAARRRASFNVLAL